MTDPKLTNPIFDPPPISDLRGQDNNFVVVSDFKLRQQELLHLEDIVEPQTGYSVSNRTRNNTILYIPGIRTGVVDMLPGESTSEAVFAAQQLSNMRGKPVHYVHNSTDGFAIDLAKCAACATAARFGAVAERDAVSRTIYLIDQALHSGDFPVEVCCHSGGNQVFDVAVKLYAGWMAKNGFTQEQINNTLGNIAVYRYGSPQDNAESVKSVVFENTHDPVTKLRPLIDSKNRIIDLISGKVREQSNVVKLYKNHGNADLPFDYPVNIASHSILEYIKNNDQYYDKSRRHVRPEGRAFALYKSIESGFFSDPEFEKIIHLMLTSSEISKVDKMAFAIEFSRLAPAPQRRIGNYYLSQNSIDLLNQKSKGY